MNLSQENCFFERAWVFRVEGCDCDTSLILHGHSILEWSKRSEVGVKNRADALTSVNRRLAHHDGSGWKQAGVGYGKVINRGSRPPTYPPPEEIKTRLFG